MYPNGSNQKQNANGSGTNQEVPEFQEGSSSSQNITISNSQRSLTYKRSIPIGKQKPVSCVETQNSLIVKKEVGNNLTRDNRVQNYTKINESSSQSILASGSTTGLKCFCMDDGIIYANPEVEQVLNSRNTNYDLVPTNGKWVDNDLQTTSYIYGNYYAFLESEVFHFVKMNSRQNTVPITDIISMPLERQPKYHIFCAGHLKNFISAVESEQRYRSGATGIIPPTNQVVSEKSVDELCIEVFGEVIKYEEARVEVEGPCSQSIQIEVKEQNPELKIENSSLPAVSVNNFLSNAASKNLDENHYAKVIFVPPHNRVYRIIFDRRSPEVYTLEHTFESYEICLRYLFSLNELLHQ